MNHNNSNFQENGEKWVLHYFKKNMKTSAQNKIVFDVGANTGQYTQLLSQIFNDKTTIIFSFEPSAITFSELAKRLKSHNNIRIFNFGFSEKSEEIAFFSNDPNSTSSLASIYDRQLEHIGLTMQLSEKINVVTIDYFCIENNITHIDFFKIDVEGHELNVLKGAANMIKEKRIYAIQFEFGACAIDSRTYFKDFFNLLSKNYHLFRIVKNGMHPINKYNQILEIFNYSNYLAILKSDNK